MGHFEATHEPRSGPGGESFSQKFGVTIISIEVLMMILYGLVADYKIYSTSNAEERVGGDVLQHYGKFQDVRVPPCPNPAP